MRCVWATDIHLNFVNAQHRFQFAEAVLVEEPDIVLLGGDIGEADTHAQLRKCLRGGQTDTVGAAGNNSNLVLAKGGVSAHKLPWFNRLARQRV